MTGDVYSALVIGCGRIGAFWDKPGDTHMLTHAHAYHMNAKVTSLGFVDHDPLLANRAAELWGGKAYPDLATALAEARPNVASVCTPDDAHYSVLNRLLDSDIRLILAEKPLTRHSGEAEKVVQRSREKGIIINVNYSRRFDATVSEVRTALQGGEYGKVLNVVGTYTKGILHNGSHLIDLLRHLLGEVLDSKVLAKRSGYGVHDSTLDCWLRMQDCPSVHLVGLIEECYSVYEVDIFCELGRLRFTRFGLYLESQTVVLDPVFPGYRELSTPEIKPTKLSSAMARFLDDGLTALLEGREPLCPAGDAAKTLQVCQDLLEKSKIGDGNG